MAKIVEIEPKYADYVSKIIRNRWDVDQDEADYFVNVYLCPFIGKNL